MRRPSRARRRCWRPATSTRSSSRRRPRRTPTWPRRRWTGALAVLVEKPLAPNLADARRLAEAAATAGSAGDGGLQPAAPGGRGAPARCCSRTSTAAPIRSTRSSTPFPTVWDPVAGVARPARRPRLTPPRPVPLSHRVRDRIRGRPSGSRTGRIELRVDLESGSRAACTVSQGSSEPGAGDGLHRRRGGGPGARSWRLRPSFRSTVRPSAARARAVLDRGDKLVRRLRGRPDPMTSIVRGPARGAWRAALGVTFASAPDVEDGVAVVRAVEAARARLEDSGRGYVPDQDGHDERDRADHPDLHHQRDQEPQPAHVGDAGDRAGCR